MQPMVFASSGLIRMAEAPDISQRGLSADPKLALNEAFCILPEPKAFQDSSDAWIASKVVAKETPEGEFIRSVTLTKRNLGEDRTFELLVEVEGMAHFPPVVRAIVLKDGEMHEHRFDSQVLDLFGDDVRSKISDAIYDSLVSLAPEGAENILEILESCARNTAHSQFNETSTRRTLESKTRLFNDALDLSSPILFDKITFFETHVRLLQDAHGYTIECSSRGSPKDVCKAFLPKTGNPLRFDQIREAASDLCSGNDATRKGGMGILQRLGAQFYFNHCATWSDSMERLASFVQGLGYGSRLSGLIESRGSDAKDRLLPLIEGVEFARIVLDNTAPSSFREIEIHRYPSGSHTATLWNGYGGKVKLSKFPAVDLFSASDQFRDLLEDILSKRDVEEFFRNWGFKVVKESPNLCLSSSHSRKLLRTLDDLYKAYHRSFGFYSISNDYSPQTNRIDYAKGIAELSLVSSSGVRLDIEVTAYGITSVKLPPMEHGWGKFLPKSLFTSKFTYKNLSIEQFEVTLHSINRQRCEQPQSSRLRVRNLLKELSERIR